MLPEGAVIGILGGGQLGRQLAIAAAQLGFETHIYAPEADSSAAQVAALHTRAEYADMAALARFADAVDVITFEFENIPLAAAEALAARGDLFPSPRALAVAQDRLFEKRFLNDLGIETAAWVDADEINNTPPLPAIVKTRRFGYDGKGQIAAKTAAEIDAACAELNAPAIIEARVDFTREIALCAARDQTGEMAFYDCVETHHEGGILRRVEAPAKMSAAQIARARHIARHIAEALDYVGMLAVEMFDAAGALLVNEIAPRVHNSGHWTIEGCSASQFTQHIRAIAGWPLASTARLADARMINIIGRDRWEDYIGAERTAIHLYNKGAARDWAQNGAYHPASAAFEKLNNFAALRRRSISLAIKALTAPSLSPAGER